MIRNEKQYQISFRKILPQAVQIGPMVDVVNFIS